MTNFEGEKPSVPIERLANMRIAHALGQHFRDEPENSHSIRVPQNRNHLNFAFIDEDGNIIRPVASEEEEGRYKQFTAANQDTYITITYAGSDLAGDTAEGGPFFELPYDTKLSYPAYAINEARTYTTRMVDTLYDMRLTSIVQAPDGRFYEFMNTLFFTNKGEAFNLQEVVGLFDRDDPESATTAEDLEDEGYDLDKIMKIDFNPDISEEESKRIVPLTEQDMKWTENVLGILKSPTFELVEYRSFPSMTSEQ
ncbi:MAG TPA: hypothetical protein VHE53_03040 [Patescibacteria group bacterium]|nr:hypothetical protein [Patescibacteria group bacterium]